MTCYYFMCGSDEIETRKKIEGEIKITKKKSTVFQKILKKLWLLQKIYKI